MLPNEEHQETGLLATDKPTEQSALLHSRFD
jgi:hypothetical protein